MLVDCKVLYRCVKNDNINVVTTVLYSDYRSWIVS